MSGTSFEYLKAPAPEARRENDPLTETTIGEKELVNTPFIKAVEEKVRLSDGKESRRFLYSPLRRCRHYCLGSGRLDFARETVASSVETQFLGTACG